MLNSNNPEQTIKIGDQLSDQVQGGLVDLLIKYKDVFAWKHEEILEIDTNVISHYLTVDNKNKPVIQKRHMFNPKRSEAIKEEIEKLLASRSIREVKYPKWVAKMVLVKKKNRQWMMCVNFTDLNKACPNDSFLLLRIDQLADAIVGNEMFGFMDVYSAK